MQSMQSMQTRQATALHVQTALCMSRRQPDMKKVCFPSTNHTWESMQSMPCSPCHAVHPMQSMQTMLHVQTCPRGMYHVPRACTMSQGHVPYPETRYRVHRVYTISRAKKCRIFDFSRIDRPSLGLIPRPSIAYFQA